MFPKMEELMVSAIVGELASRSISFVIQTCSKRKEPPSTDEEKLDSLQRLLLRVGAVVEDAEGRLITNQTMLQQLNTMRQEMNRGHFALDTFRCHAHDHDHDDLERSMSISDHESGGHPSAHSMFNNPAKRLRIRSGCSQSAVELQRILEGLETIIHDATEFLQLSGRYPRLSRQPYSMYLLLDNFMFGRQMEHVINFLHQGAQDPSAEHLGVLPIVFPVNVGKSTLVEHVCIDERVCDHFSQIMCIRGGDLSGEDVVTLAHETGVIKYENREGSGEGRVLVIVEADRDINEDSWQRLYKASEARLARGSKIIVTSRSDKIIGFGTTLPLRMQFLSQEAYWYFFKVRIFGSVDVTREHPKLASIAMEMAGETQGCFTGASLFRRMLKSSFDVGTWNLALSMYREFKQKNRFISNMNPIDPWSMSRPVLVPSVNKAAPGYYVIVDCYQTSSSHGVDGESCKVWMQDVMLGTASPQGKFAALAWRSHLPPHYNYMHTCELRKPAVSAASNKRIHRRRK